MGRELLIYAGLALLLIIVIVSLVKKAFKIVLFLLSVIVLVSCYNIFIKGVSPIDEFNAYKKDIKYGKSITEYTIKIKTSTDTIKEIVESKKIDETSLNTLKKENENLLQYQKEVKELEHSTKLNMFHNNYCGYLNTIVTTSDTAVKVASSGNKTLQATEDMLNKLKLGLNNLSELKLEINK
jgi:hypothetical protein